MTRKRANETQEETMDRKGENTARMKRRRVNETQEETIKRKRLDNQRISTKRNESNIDIVMKSFHCQVKVGPVYVCTVCHRLMYKEGVVKVQVAKYNKSSSELLQNVFAVKFHIKSFNKQGWICRTCDSAPIQAKAYGLTLDEVPQELSDLRLISMRIPFMKMIALPHGLYPWTSCQYSCQSLFNL